MASKVLVLNNGNGNGKGNGHAAGEAMGNPSDLFRQILAMRTPPLLNEMQEAYSKISELMEAAESPPAIIGFKGTIQPSFDFEPLVKSLQLLKRELSSVLLHGFDGTPRSLQFGAQAHNIAMAIGSFLMDTQKLSIGGRIANSSIATAATMAMPLHGTLAEAVLQANAQVAEMLANAAKRGQGQPMGERPH